MSGLATRVEPACRKSFEELRPAWTQLCNELEDCEPFERPEWFEACLPAANAPAANAPQGEASSERRLVTVWLGQRLRAVFPVARERGWVAGLPVWRLVPLAPLHHGRVAIPVCRGPERKAVLAVLWQAVASLRWHVIDLPGSPEGGAWSHLLEVATGHGYPGTAETLWSSYSIPLHGPCDGMPGWLHRTRPKFRANLRRTEKQIADLGEVAFTRRTAAEPASLEQFYRLEASGWKGAEGTAIACQPKLRAFYDALAAAAARSQMLSLDFLEVGGVPIAGHFALQHNGRYYLLKAAYDEEFRRFGPGQLLVMGILRQSADRQIQGLDFVAEGTWDESRWSPVERPHYHVFVFDRGLYGRLLFHLRISLWNQLKRRARFLHTVLLPVWFNAGAER